MNSVSSPLVLIRGGGDLASGVALRLYRSGFSVIITELQKPLTVRRLASFSQAAFDGQCHVEEVQCVRVFNPQNAMDPVQKGKITLLIDPDAGCRSSLPFVAQVDGRMLKKPEIDGFSQELFTIGLGPGFICGVNCHAVVETNRGAFMGRVYWQGSAEEDTGIPESVSNHQADRVLRSPVTGTLECKAEIGSLLEPGDLIAHVNDEPILAPFKGVLRGLVYTGLLVKQGAKIGDLDPRCDPRLCTLVSDKSLAVGGGVLEALLAKPAIRTMLAAKP